MKIDRYTKVVLTIIAVGVIGLNVHFFKDGFVKEAHAEVESHRHYISHIRYFEREVEDIIEDCYATGYAYSNGYYKDRISC